MNKSLELLFFTGRIFSPLYALLMKARIFFYETGLFKKTRLSVPVLSVGNLTMGGTGKTPMVMYIARLLSKKYRTAIVSRGYGSSARCDVNVVSDGESVFLSPAEAGDEPYLLAESLPGVSVLTGPKRAFLGRYAVDKLAAELVIMDDGFQHVALCRDCNLVLFSATELLGNGWVCPGGPLREPFSALRRADAFVVVGGESHTEHKVRAFARDLSGRFPEKSLFFGKYRPVGFIGPGGLEAAPGSFRGLSFLAFCGIATPTSFLNSLSGEGLEVKEFVSFRDHHHFSQADADAIERRAALAGCDTLVTTAKDFVKLKSLKFKMPLWVLKVELEMGPGFDEYVIERISKRS